MLFIKKQYLVSQAHYSLTVKSSPVSIDKIKLLFQLVNKDVTISQSYITCYHSCGKNIQWKKMTLSPDFIFTFYTFSLFSLVRPKYFPHTRLVWLLITFTFSPDQSGKTPILPHQTSLLRRWRLIVTRPVWCSPSRLHPMPSLISMNIRDVISLFKCLRNQ